MSNVTIGISQMPGYLAGCLEASGTTMLCYTSSNVKCQNVKRCQMSNVPYKCTYQIPWLATLPLKPCHVTHKMSNVICQKCQKCQMLYINIHIKSHGWLPCRLLVACTTMLCYISNDTRYKYSHVTS